METLELTLSAPIASFGFGMRLQHRLTQVSPTKTALVGLIACAMGLSRDDDLGGLNSISFSTKNVDLVEGMPLLIGIMSPIMLRSLKLLRIKS